MADEQIRPELPDEGPVLDTKLEPVVIEWPAAPDLGLPEYSLTIPANYGSGLLCVYRTPAIGDMGGYRYEQFYNTTNEEQRPGCLAEDCLELARIRVAGTYGLNESLNPDMLVSVVEYLHPDVPYAHRPEGDITAEEAAPAPEDPSSNPEPPSNPEPQGA